MDQFNAGNKQLALSGEIIEQNYNKQKVRPPMLLRK